MAASEHDDVSIHLHPAELLQKLIRFDTTNPPGNEAQCIAYIDHLLKQAGIETLILAKDRDRPNLVARISGRGASAPLLMNGHVDVVSAANQNWTYPPFGADVVEGHIWGRGALDMKSGVAMMLSAFLRTKVEGTTPPGDVVLAILSDEEAGGDYGAHFLVEQHADLFRGIRFAVGELVGFSRYFGGRKFHPIQVSEKQACWMKATLRGPGGHGSAPIRGGATAKLAKVLDGLDRHQFPVHVTPAARQMINTMASALPLPSRVLIRQLLNHRLTNLILRLMGDQAQFFVPLSHNTVSVTMVQGGDKINVIPSEITVCMDGRLLPGGTPENMITELRHIIGDEITIEIVRYDEGPSEPDMGLFNTLADILREADPIGTPVPTMVAATTDARFFSRLGIQTYGFVPMNLPDTFDYAGLIHAADERIPVESMEFGSRAIYELLQRFDRQS